MCRMTPRPRPLHHSPCAQIVLQHLQTHRIAAHCARWLCCSGLMNLPKELKPEACHKALLRPCHWNLQKRNKFQVQHNTFQVQDNTRYRLAVGIAIACGARSDRELKYGQILPFKLCVGISRLNALLNSVAAAHLALYVVIRGSSASGSHRISFAPASTSACTSCCTCVVRWANFLHIGDPFSHDNCSSFQSNGWSVCKPGKHGIWHCEPKSGGIAVHLPGEYVSVPDPATA